MRDVARLTTWLLLVWLLLVWSLTWEALAIGVLAALAGGVSLGRRFRVPGPWRLLRPDVLLPMARLAGYLLGRIVVANLRLSRQVWTTGRPPASAIVLVPTRVRTDGQLVAVGLLSSLVVDNQIVDVDRDDQLLAYHVLEAPPRDPDRAYASVNGPIESRLLKVGADV